MTHHLAQLNVGIPVAPLDSATLAPFMDALDSVNERADTAPGFVWRLQTEDGNATAVVPAMLGPEWIVNMSTWESIEALRDFVYRDPAHLAIMRRRREFFEQVKLVLVLWWVPVGHRPTVAEAEERLALLDRLGPTPDAFTFRESFAAPGTPAAAAPVRDDRDLCPA